MACNSSPEHGKFRLLAVFATMLLNVPVAAFAPPSFSRISAFRPSVVGQSCSNHQRRNSVMMAGMALPQGSLVALATPMTSNGNIDIPALRELLRWHLAEGTNGVVILGTTGEASCLSDAEKGEVMAVTREEVGGVLPIIVGTGTISTTGTIAATKQAQLFGADAALVVTPYYVRPSQTGLQEHFKAIADAAEIPLVLYNVPGRTGVDLSVESTIALSRHPMIHGLKDATGDNTRVVSMRAVCDSGFRLYSGEDDMAREYVLQGGDGVISVTANVAPAAVSKVMAAAAAKDSTTAEAADEPLSALHRDLFCEANPIPVKWALNKMGKTSDGIRLPLSPLDISLHGRVEKALQQANCIPIPEGDADGGSVGWPSRDFLLQGQLFDEGLINQALDIIEKRGGDFEIISFSVAPNDQRVGRSELLFKRPSSVVIKVYGVDETALGDIVSRLQTLVDVVETAEGSLTEILEEETEEQ